MLVELNKVLDYVQPTKYLVESTDYSDDFETPVLTAGKSFLLGYTNEKEGIYSKPPVIIFDDFTTSFHFVDFPFKVKSSALKILKRKNDEVDIKYVYYAMSRIQFEPELHKRYWISKYSKFQIPLPPLATQKKIAALLDAADAHRQKTRQLLAKYDELAQSIFLEMFGDPVSNPRKFKSISLCEVAEISSGITKGRKGKVVEYIGDLPYMRVANVQDGYLDLSEVKTIPAFKSDLQKYLLRVGDVLMTEGGDPDKLGRGAVWKGKIKNCLHQNHIFKVRVNPEILEPLYFSYLSGGVYGKRYFLKVGKQTTGIASINKKQLSNFPVLLAPLSLQKDFSKRIEKIQNQKENVQSGIDKTEDLFNSLLQKAFKGELVK